MFERGIVVEGTQGRVTDEAFSIPVPRGSADLKNLTQP